MALRGDLASVDLAQVFQMLAHNQKVGLLSIQSTRLWKVLYFDNRGVTVHHNVHQLLDRIVAILTRPRAMVRLGDYYGPEPRKLFYEPVQKMIAPPTAPTAPAAKAEDDQATGQMI